MLIVAIILLGLSYWNISNYTKTELENGNIGFNISSEDYSILYTDYIDHYNKKCLARGISFVALKVLEVVGQNLIRSEINDKIDEILEDATEGRKTQGKTKQWEKEGGYQQALEDFDKLDSENVSKKVTNKGEVIIGTLPDGRTVNVRDHSSEGNPTLDIQDGKKHIKIRYK